MPGFYSDAGVPVQVIEFGIVNVKSDNTGVMVEAPQGFLTKVKMMHVIINWNTGVNGERGFWPRFLSPTGATLFDTIGGDDYYATSTTAPPAPLNISYAVNAGTPTFSFAANPASIPQVNITILPDLWLEAGAKIIAFCQNWQAGDKISEVTGVLEIREDIGRGGFGANVPPIAGQGALAYLLHQTGA